MSLKKIEEYITEVFRQKLIYCPGKVPRTKEAITDILKDILNEVSPAPEISFEQIKESISIEIVEDKINIRMQVPLSIVIEAEG